ncbi:MAG: hypothetical protein J6A19_09990 [Oscillospiraceae bacterium]|nr:hypothetical protein [Oscillospiraceae bacterium]
MENNNNIITTVPAAEGKKQNAERNPLARFFSAAKSKCKKVITTVTTMVTMAIMTAVPAFAEGEGEGGVVDGEAAFNQVVGFFATWIGRIGLVVAFVGGVMFALAIKNDDAEAKTIGLMTLASGFVVFALTLSLNLFGITA